MQTSDFIGPIPGERRVMAVARIVMGGAFVYFGLTKLLAINGIISFVGLKLPFPGFVFWLAVVLETGCGLLLVLGLKTKWVAAWLAFYCVFTAVVFHSNFTVMPVRDHFVSNLVMAAGFLYLFATGPGAWAMDNERSVD
jgi:putative oxidoreductase